jgi:hypothetical protein
VKRLTLILVVTFIAAADVSAQSANTVVRGDVQIGRFLVKRDGTLGGAIRAFGRPPSLKRADVTCLARWRNHGLSISFYNLGGRDPCKPQYGYFGQAIITGRQWTTAKGLRIGDTASRIRALYGSRRVSGSWVWLVTRRSPYGGNALYSALAVKIHRGRVAAFRVRHQAGGD